MVVLHPRAGAVSFFLVGAGYILNAALRPHTPLLWVRIEAYFGACQFWSSVIGGVAASVISTIARNQPSRATS